MHWQKLNRTALSTLLVAAGNTLVMGAGLITTILLMRYFPPSDYGIITTLIALMSVLPVFMDFGTTPSLIRFSPYLKARMNVDAQVQCFRAVLWLRIGLGSTLFILGLLLLNPLSEYLLHRRNAAAVLFALIGSIGVSFLQFLTNILQAEERFVAMTVFRLIEAMTKIGFVVILVFAFRNIQPEYAVLVYAMAPFLAIIASIPYVPWNYLLGRLDFKIFMTMVRFSFYYMISTVSLMIFMNFDIFILAVLKPQSEVGLYGAGYRLASFLYVIVNALNTVLMPKVSKKLDTSSMMVFLRKTIIVSFLISIACIPFSMLGKPIISYLTDTDYLPAEPVFFLTAWDHIVMILFTPLMIALLVVNRPGLVALVTVCEMVLNIAGDIVFVPDYGASGAAAVTLATRVIVGAISSWYVWHKLKNDTRFVRQVF